MTSTMDEGMIKKPLNFTERAWENPANEPVG